MIDVVERDYGVKISDFFNDVLEDDLRKDISHQWSLEAEVECCYGPCIIID